MTTTKTDLERLFKRGVAAYKTGEHQQAQAAFNKLSQCNSRTYRVKAGMGLVRIYMDNSQWAQARALCTKLSESSAPSVQQWAADTLQKIERAARSPQTKSAQSTASQKSGSSPPSTSGFQPLSPTASTHTPPTSKPPSGSGFQPLSPEDLSSATGQASTASPLANSSAESSSSKQQNTPKATQREPSIYRLATGDVAADELVAGELADSEQPTHEQPHQSTVSPSSKPPSTSTRVANSPTDSTEGQAYELTNAGRLGKAKSLGKMKRSQIWFSQLLGAIALFQLLMFFLRMVLHPINRTIDKLYNVLPNWIGQISEGTQYLTTRLAIVLFVVLLASPWLWDLWLRFTANRQSFSIAKLRSISPEAATLLGKRCGAKRWPIPKLWKLPTDVPLIFSYGWLPRNARLVVSEGLLSELAADEIATLVSYELSHWKTFYWPLLSFQHLLLQPLHRLYWALAFWGNRQNKPLRYAAGTLATVSYVAFWLVRIPGLWISRVRTYYGDRTATEVTGNPNALTRALVKLSFGLAKSVDDQGYTPATVESLSLLLPVSADIARQPMYQTVPLTQLFAWDTQHPLRSWMSLSNAHPPLGDRLRVIMAYARHWKLDLEIPLEAPTRKKKALSRDQWAQLISQGLPFFGFAFGMGMGLLLWIIGAIAGVLNLNSLTWMYQDTELLTGCILMGFGVCTLLRINRFFPDLSFNLPTTTTLTPSVTDTTLLPVSSVPAKLAGKLLGRPGIANWLGQDLMLKTTENQLIRLHLFSMLGPLGNLIGLQPKAAANIGQSVQLLGWFRRGNHPWLDIDKLRLGNGTVLQAAHPIFSLLVSLASIGMALWLLGFKQMFEAVAG